MQPKPGPIDFAKNSYEIVRVERSEYRGFDVIGVRIFTRDRDDKWQPSKRGITIKYALLPKLIQALQAFAEVEGEE